MASKGSEMDRINERREVSKGPKIYRFDTFKKGKHMYGSIKKYKEAINAIDKINEEVKAILHRDSPRTPPSDGDKTK